jgi:hypothetical protein
VINNLIQDIIGNGLMPNNFIPFTGRSIFDIIEKSISGAECSDLSEDQ